VEFPVNCSTEVEPSDRDGSDGRVWVGGCICPNCRQQIRFTRRGEAPDPEAGLIEDPGPRTGDRVLVAKFVYDLLGRDPSRLDVVVFKFPGEKDFPLTGPFKRHSPLNYIKRLIGRPEETIAIHRGKLYYLPANDPHALRYDDVEQCAGDPNKLALLWQPSHMHINDEQAQKLFREGRVFRIIRKDPDAMLAMRRLVYDNDHQAKDLQKDGDRWKRWVGGKGWKEDGPTGYRFEPGEGDRAAWLHYRHVLRNLPDKPQLITDFMGYNTWEGGSNARGSHAPPGQNWASDLMLECEVDVDKAEGEITLELSKGEDRFQARFDLASRKCTLYRLRQGKVEELGQRDSGVGRGTYRLRLANVDDRLTVWVDNRLPFDEGLTYKEAVELVPTRENDLERPASVGVKGARVAVRHLKLFRDTYYTSRGSSPGSADVSDFDPSAPATWKKLDEAPVSTYYVQPGHYLCLGDNSPESSDGRSWGLVPRRLMLGRALLVYYPFYRAGRIR
jgi:signal peptidase I